MGGVISPYGGDYLPANLAASETLLPVNPTGTSSVTEVMMGFGAQATPIQYKPTGTGKVLVLLTGTAQASVASVGITVGGRYGTGAAPANGAAVTGTNVSTDQQVHPVGTGFTAFSIQGEVQLVPGTTYWFDLALATNTIADTVQVTAVAATFLELPA